MSMRILALVAPALLGGVPTVDAAVHSAVIFTRTGERTPLLQTSGPASLTPWGAQQAHDQGNFFRQLYVSGETNEGDATGPRAIVDLSKDALKNDQIFVLSPENDYATATAMAFMQGLYPPLGMNMSNAALLDGAATLSNGSFVQAPLGGYQYPQLRTASNNDPNLIYVAGAYGCVNAAKDRDEYFNTAESSETKNRTGELYNNVGNAVLLGAISEESWNYDRAYLIYDYVNYAYWHDSSVQRAFANNETLRGTLDPLRYLADQQQWAMVNSTDPAHFVRSIAGQALASKILNQLYVNINTAGSAAKLSLLFGEFDPMLAFVGLTGLSDEDPDLRGIPDWASSLVVELYSDDPPGQSSNTSVVTSNSTDGFTATYPDVANLSVRFYLRNGSDPYIPLNQYGIFQNPPPQQNQDGADNNAPSPLMPDPVIPAWCAVCEARSLFCTALNADLRGPKDGGRKNRDRDNGDDSALSPAAAGVLGAGFAAKAASASAATAATLPCLPSSKRRRRNRCNASFSNGGGGGGGFKGSDKLESDLDVSFACNGAPPGSHASIAGFVPPPPPSPPPKAAARMSSIMGLNRDSTATPTGGDGKAPVMVGVGGTGTVSGTPISDAYARSNRKNKDNTFAGLGSGGVGIREPIAHARSGSWELKEKAKNANADATNATLHGNNAADDTRSNLSGSTNVSGTGTAVAQSIVPVARPRSTIAKVGDVGGVATVHQSPFASGDGEDDDDVFDSRRSSGEVFEDAVAVEVVHRV
ncbi:histidine phosphatase superfamily [Phyllosticta citriasiana]|uniref:Histidine phosphatase superfamily n=1 Tax=Phyllosticta citriasiana TaxID=595635 RepID=A0ABR1KF53_9PEZI